MSGTGAATIETLDTSACHELLQMHSFVGRIGFDDGGLPTILPVNYIAEADAVYFCTLPGAKLRAAETGAMVAFEVDGSHPLDHAGWSVLVRGHAEHVTDEDTVERLRRGPLRSWALVGPDRQWVRIPIEQISGIRLRGH